MLKPNTSGWKRRLSSFEPELVRIWQDTGTGLNENLLLFFRRRGDLFPLRRECDLERFLTEALGGAIAALPLPTKIYPADDHDTRLYGFSVMRTPALDDLESRLARWIGEEIAGTAGDAAFRHYIDSLLAMAQNAQRSSILADYHALFWLVHSQQLAHALRGLPAKAIADNPRLSRDGAEGLKYSLFAKWAEAVKGVGCHLLRLLIDNVLLVTEELVSGDLRELRAYFGQIPGRDYTSFRTWFDAYRGHAAEQIQNNRVVRRAMALLGYDTDTPPAPIALYDVRVQQLLLEEVDPFFAALSKKIIEFHVIDALRHGLVWMHTAHNGDNIGDADERAYSRAMRPVGFGRRGVVEPIVYRFGLVYDITSFTQTLGEIARTGKENEQSSYLQMIDFQRDLAEITNRNGLQFEKFLGDGAFYTSRHATRAIQAALEIQQFYSTMRKSGFAFSKGMRIALNYGYYRLLPMRLSADGPEIKEFYGPGIVELSRLTTGKSTRELEDIQHLLISHGYDQMEVYLFFAPLERAVDTTEETLQQREFYAYVNANGHLVNEGIVVSMPFVKELTNELAAEQQKLYRLQAKWAGYVGFRSTAEPGVYIGVRILGSASLQGIGGSEVAEVVRLSNEEAEVSVIEDAHPLMRLLRQERNRSAARLADSARAEGAGSADLVVCQSHAQTDTPPVIYLGEWDPVAEEVRRPIQFDSDEAERYGLAVPLTAENVESQIVTYQKLYQKLSRLETLPNFPVQALKHNVNFSGFIIGATVERL